MYRRIKLTLLQAVRDLVWRLDVLPGSPSPTVMLIVRQTPTLPERIATEHLELTVTPRLENGIRLENKTNEPVESFVSTFDDEGKDDFYGISPNASESWRRTKLQTIAVKTADGMSAACLVGPCSTVTVRKVFSVHPLTHSKEDYDGRIRVHNKSNETIAVYVSKYENDSGSDSWYDIAPNTCDDWKRDKTQLVVVKTQSGASYGYYLSPGHLVTYDPVI
ncbi:hypothetical protein HDU79_005890 [Rhizoclosmatium sp. JEL0117]|nr:hypothetical protein HDU79_005890 [Rhizoclosmatium sp. JEL0117]